MEPSESHHVLQRLSTLTLHPLSLCAPTVQLLAARRRAVGSSRQPWHRAVAPWYVSSHFPDWLSLKLILPTVHQIIGGNAFNVSMDPNVAPPDAATCTTCTFAEDFSNYWTASLYFRAKNGTFKRVPQKGNVNFEQSNGGMTVYYIPKNVNGATPGAVTAFKKGFRMLVGNPTYRSEAEAKRFRQLTYTCLQNMNTRTGETLDFPKKACPAGLMINVRVSRLYP